jgi:L-fuculose-phosphate aldolase
VGHDALLLANHGAVAYGPTLDGAINAMESIEQAARSMLVARLLGRVNLLSREDVDRLLTLDAYGTRPRNVGCAVAGSEPPGEMAAAGPLQREVADIVREALARRRS